VLPPEAPEERYAGGDPLEYARRVAEAKAAEVAGRLPGEVVVGADTIVVVEGEVLGKPGSWSEARAMLERLSGRSHTVSTAVAVVNGGRRGVDSDSTRLTLRPLSAADIEWYLETGEPMDKAGGYALQGEAARFVTGVDGDPETVIGLPTALVRRLLRELG
jgi:nucleoside triphosphate pyrophosphatase